MVARAAACRVSDGCVGTGGMCHPEFALVTHARHRNDRTGATSVTLFYARCVRTFAVPL